MKHLNKRTGTLYLLLLCIITVAIACLLSAFNKQSKTAFAATESEPAVLNIIVEVSETDVYFQKEGGTGGSRRVTATYGEPMPQATAPERDNYSFKGYFSERLGQGTQYYDENKMRHGWLWHSSNSKHKN